MGIPVMIKPFEIVVTDLEGNGLYHQGDRVHCAVIIDAPTGTIHEYGPDDLERYLEDLSTAKMCIGHNLCDYDFPYLEKLLGFSWTKDQVFDTLVLSRLLFPDRPGGHSLGAWGERLGEQKIDWRAKAVELGLISVNAPRGAEFITYHPAMLDYCAQDGIVNLKLMNFFMKQLGWNWKDVLEWRKVE